MPAQPSLKLLKVLKLRATLETVTGLLISAGRSVGRIGGADIEPVSTERVYRCDNDKPGSIRVPYIPGSSLKGRMRALLEVSLGLPLYSLDGKIWAHTPTPGARKALSDEEKNRLSVSEVVDVILANDLDRLFGFPALHLNDVAKDASNRLDAFLSALTPTALLVDDFFPDQEYVCNIYKGNGLVTFDDFLEEKNENRIDRITSAADPRTALRVKPGVVFTGNISLLIYDKNAGKLRDFLTLLAKGMKLLEATYLGASGSRGYGRVKFTKIEATVLDPATMSETKPLTLNSTDELASKVNDLVSLVGVSK